MLTQEEQAAYDEAILENKEDIAVDAILSIIQAGMTFPTPSFARARCING